MPTSSGDKLCPICDSPLQPGSKKCGFCGTDLSIFEIESEPPKRVPEPVAAPARPSVDSMVDEIFSRPAPRETPVSRPAPAPKPVVVESAPPTAPEEPEEVIVPPKEPAVTATVKPVGPETQRKEEPAPKPSVEYFECPECGTAIETTASSCPKCGVMFSEEGTEMFQCPACNTLVNVDAKTCPGCGAMFVEPEAAIEDTEAVPEKKVRTAPVSKAEPEVKATKIVEPEPEEPVEKKSLFGGLFKRGKKEPEPVARPHEKKPSRETIAPATPPKPQQTVIREARPPVREEAPAPKPVMRTEVVPAPAAHAPTPAPAPPAGKDKGRELALMVAEMKPLLTLAHEKEIDTGESKQLIDEAASAGREKQLDKALELVGKSKSMLMSHIEDHLSQTLSQLNEEIKVAKDLGGDISRAQTYVQEIARARSAGDVEAAYVYTDKVSKELQPITGRYNESKKKIAALKQFISDCEALIIDTKEARKLIVEANRASDAKDFDKVDAAVRSANDSLNKTIPSRMNDEMKKAKDQLLEAKMRNVNITPLITVLKSVTNVMKAGDYPQAIKEMREFRDLIKKSG